MKRVLAAAGFVLAGGIMAAPAGAATVYSNDFTGGAAGTASNGASSAGFVGGVLYPNTSPNGQFLGLGDNTVGALGSTLTISGLTPNSIASISFNLYTLASLDGDSNDDRFSASFTGASSSTLVDETFGNVFNQSYAGAGNPSTPGSPGGTGSIPSENGVIQAPGGSPDYNYYGPNHTYLLTFNNLEVSGTGTAVFTFLSSADQGWNDEGFGIDNVNVSGSSVATTPIPAALPLFMSGLAALGWVGRRQRKKATASA